MGRPSRHPTERTGFLDDNRERLWERVHAKQRRFLGEPFRGDRILCKCTSKVFELIHVLYQEVRDSQGACTEHLCNECWLSTDGDSSPEYLSESTKETRASGSTLVWKMMTSGMKMPGSSFWKLMPKL